MSLMWDGFWNGFRMGFDLLQGGMKVDETTNPVGSTEERNMRRKHSEIGDLQISDVPEYIKREMGIASRRSEESERHGRQKFTRGPEPEKSRGDRISR